MDLPCPLHHHKVGSSTINSVPTSLNPLASNKDVLCSPILKSHKNQILLQVIASNCALRCAPFCCQLISVVDVNVFNYRFIPNSKYYWLPYSTCNKSRSPIPTKVISSLSSKRSSLLALYLLIHFQTVV